MDYLLPLICTLVGIAGVIFSIIIAGVVRNAPTGNEKMMEIAAAIKSGAIAYLNRQLKSMGIAGIVLFIIIGFALNWKTAIGFNRSDRVFCCRICRDAGIGAGQRTDG